MKNDPLHDIINNMSKPELVLSNITSFFLGRVETVFENAKKYGFKYLEIIPYRWINPLEILDFEKKYGVEVAGIHMPVWWKKSLGKQINDQNTLLDKLFTLLWAFYLGPAAASPGMLLASILQAKKPYLLFHSDVIDEMDAELANILEKFQVLIENIPYHPAIPRFYWDPVTIKTSVARHGFSAGLVFDLGHFNQSREKLPDLNLFDTYQKIAPEVIHISYNSQFIHTLPNEKEREELKQLLKIHAPKYIVIETNPLVSIKKGKQMIDKILSEVYPAPS